MINIENFEELGKIETGCLELNDIFDYENQLYKVVKKEKTYIECLKLIEGKWIKVPKKDTNYSFSNDSSVTKIK